MTLFHQLLQDSYALTLPAGKLHRPSKPLFDQIKFIQITQSFFFGSRFAHPRMHRRNHQIVQNIQVFKERIFLKDDADVKAIGKRIAAVHDAVKSSTLTTALGTLLTLGGTVSAPVLAAVSAAADVLTTVVASALQDNGDDLVSLFEGTYGVESILGSKTDRYVQAGAEIELDFVVSSASAAATKGSPATKKSTTKKTARKKAK